MISYYDGQLTDVMPWNIIRNPEVKAISYALQQGCRILYKYSRRLYLYTNLEEQPEEIIDLLAAELRTQYYNGALDIKTKRQLVRNTLIWHMTAGTPAAVEELVTVAFGKGEVKEWFEYGDRPYFFKVLIDAIFTPNMDVFFTVNLGKVKNTRSHLRAIEIHRTVEQKIYAGIGHSGYYRPAAIIDGYDVTRKHRQIIYVGAVMADMVRPAAIIDGFQMKGSQVCQSYIGIGTASKARAMDIIEGGMQISMNEEGYYAATI